MLDTVRPIRPSHRALFPTWRGDVPYRDRLPLVRAALLARSPGLAAAIVHLPFARFEAAHYPSPAVHCYRWVPAPARAALDTIPAALRPAWLCALLLDRMEQADTAFAASGLDDEFALHYTDCFHRILDQIDRDPGFADIARDGFLKDLWITRCVMIPAFASILWPRSGLSGRQVIRGGVRAIDYVVRRCGGRRPMIEGHTHDPMARAYWNERGWQETMRLCALALIGQPHLRGSFGIAWYYDPAVLEITPKLAYTHRLQIGRGACRFRIGSSQATINHALAASAARRNRHAEGRYLPTDYAIMWSRRAMIAAHGPR
jgi:hypothetical protein